MRILNKKIVLCFSFLLFEFASSQAQTFREVGCKALKNRETFALGLYGDNLLHSGFDSICGSYIGVVSLWNGVSWSRLSEDIPPNNNITWGPRAFVENNGNLYVGGGGYNIGSKVVNKIARWDGTNWYPLGTGLDEQLPSDRIRSLTIYQGELYAAGTFRRINGNTGYNNIARWNGSTWKYVGTGVTRNGVGVEINSMVVFKGELYVAGYFDKAGSATAYNIARWDGTTWKSVGKGGAWNGVYSMMVDTVRNVLYVGGDFNGVDSNIHSRKIAMWDGNIWHSMPSVFLTFPVMSMAMYHGYLYAGGMSPRGLVTDTCLARWDGEKWDVILGPNSNVSSLQTYKDELYLGGSFTKIGNDTIPYLARYYSPDSVVVGLTQKKKDEIKVRVYPNPAKDELSIITSIEIEYYTIIDIRGNEVKNDKLISDKIQISELKKGMYFILFKDKKNRFVATEKFLISQ